MTPLPRIEIKPLAKHHGKFLLLLGIILFSLVLTIASVYWLDFKLVLIFLMLVSIILVLFGVLKVHEPEHSFVLSPNSFIYAHRYGQWQLQWSNIRYISQLNTQAVLTTQSLPYVGISLVSLLPLAQNISPRLASRLIHEQQPLLIHCVSQHLLQAEQVVINFAPCKLDKNTIITGPVAAFLHQTIALHQALGFHLFIPRSALDREIADFVVLLKQCKQSADNYQVS
jgi:hypothetical protein